MIITAKNVKVPKKTEPIEINFYREQLLRYVEDYGLLLHKRAKSFSESANEKAKIVIAYDSNPTNPEFRKEYNIIRDDIGGKTRILIRKYLTPLMQMIGSIAECIIIDNCKRDSALNMKCINYACFRPDIYQRYSNIDYDNYTPFSPSHKRVVIYTDSGIIYSVNNLYVYEPNHINKDIVWCHKEQHENILQAEIPRTGYNGIARLQIKASTYYGNIEWNEEKYRFSPIVYFDLNNDMKELAVYLDNRESDLFVRSIREFDLNLLDECTWYYRILAASFAGLIDINKEFSPNQTNTIDKGILRYIFNADMQSLLNDDSIVKSESLLNKLQQTIIFNNRNVFAVTATT